MSYQKNQKTLENKRKILEFLKDNGHSKCVYIADFIGLNESRTWTIINDIYEIDFVGTNKNQTYILK